MLFNSYEFLFLFFPLVLAGYGLIKRIGQSALREPYQVKGANGFLLAASLVFYGWTSLSHMPVLLGSMAVNYGLFRLMGKQERKKAALAAGLILNLGTLICFKYLGGGFLPLGISFFTFTQIAFLVESYGGNLQKAAPLSYGLYVSFFPKIMQGPIALPKEMFPQFEKRDKTVSWERIYRSFYLFILGLSKKVLLADTFGKAVDFGYTNLQALNTGDGIIVMLSYTLQLYFDFSGYCDMAMGIAGMLGFELPVNFDSPYKADNIIEFWKRWHITLTRFFTKYLYIPLGGNRKGRARTYLNCLLVFLVSGIWHGVGWQFIVWGLMHGVCYVFTRIWQDSDIIRAGNRTEKRAKKETEDRGFWEPLGRGFRVLLTFLYVNVAWIFFRASSVKEAAALIKRIGSFQLSRFSWDLAGCFNLDEFWYVIKVLRLDRWQNAHYILMVLLVAGGLLLVFCGKSALNVAGRAKPSVINSGIMAVLLVWSILSFSGVSSFLYVNF